MGLLCVQRGRNGAFEVKKELYTPAKRLENMYFSPIRQVMERVAEIVAAGHPVLSFSAGEPDFNTPQPIKDAVIKALEQNKTHYAPNRGTISLRTAISRQMERTIGVSYDPRSEIIVTAGGAESINNAFLAVLDPGDEVVVFTPAFMNYENLISMCGAKMIDVPLKAENGFRIDPEELERHLTPQTKMLVINNPCNPTGVVYSHEELKKVAEIAVRHDLLVFSDEIYNQIVYDGLTCRSLASFPGMRERTIVMNGFSKAYAMTGWRLGWLAADARLIPAILKVHQYTTTCVNTFVQEGVAEAMNAPETLRDISLMTEEFARRREILTAGLDKIGNFTYARPEGAFYMFIDVSKTGMDGDRFAERLLTEQYVACIPGSRLNAACANYVRVSYATNTENIAEGLRRIDKLVNVF